MIISAAGRAGLPSNETSLATIATRAARASEVSSSAGAVVGELAVELTDSMRDNIPDGHLAGYHHFQRARPASSESAATHAAMTGVCGQ